MIELINSYSLSEVQQGSMFMLAAIVSMLYHYVDRWIDGEERVLTSSKNIWEAGKTLATLFVGSTAWSHLYDLTNTEIITAGVALGFLAFSKGIAKFGK